jgi:hypothetical protein
MEIKEHYNEVRALAVLFNGLHSFNSRARFGGLVSEKFFELR